MYIDTSIKCPYYSQNDEDIGKLPKNKSSKKENSQDTVRLIDILEDKGWLNIRTVLKGREFEIQDVVAFIGKLHFSLCVVCFYLIETGTANLMLCVYTSNSCVFSDHSLFTNTYIFFVYTSCITVPIVLQVGIFKNMCYNEFSLAANVDCSHNSNNFTYTLFVLTLMNTFHCSSAKSSSNSCFKLLSILMVTLISKNFVKIGTSKT